MTATLSLAVTADLHWGHRRGGEAVRLLVSFLQQHPPDILILGGDLGTGVFFDDCLSLFASLDCKKALVPGNHDLWVMRDEVGFDSLELYQKLLPEACARHGFHYLDSAPLYVPEANLAIVGNVNWYDYSWAIDGIRRWYPAEEFRLTNKCFTRGRHNDFNFIRWPLDDLGFTSLITATLERHLEHALERAERVIVVTHHPPFYGLSFPREGPAVTLDSFLWDAFAGNVGVEQLLTRHADRIAFAFCGHTHRARENMLGGIRGYNIGGDYHFKRLLRLDLGSGRIEGHEFTS